MKKLFFTFLLSFLFIPSTFAVGEICGVGTDCCNPPAILAIGGGCQTATSGRVWIGPATTGSCEIPPASCPTNQYSCSTGQCIRVASSGGSAPDCKSWQVHVGNNVCKPKILTYEDSTNDYKLWNNGVVGEPIYMNSDGKVGIGVDDPGDALQLGDGSTVASMGIPNGGICIDDDGECTPLTGGLRVGRGGILGTDSTGFVVEMKDLTRVSGTLWPTSGEGMELAYSSSLKRGYIQVFDRDTATWGQLYLGEGNVGIGTKDPQQILHVNGNNEILSTGAGAGFKFRNRGSAQAGDHDWVWYSSGEIARLYREGVGDVMGIDSSGNVGIGIVDSTKKLHVAGDIRSSNALISDDAHGVDYATFSHKDQATSGGYALLQHSTGETYLNAPTSQNINFRIDNSTKMRLLANGNFGIGNTSPSTKLHVEGSTYIKHNLTLGGGTAVGTLDIRGGPSCSASPSYECLYPTPATVDIRYNGNPALYIWGTSVGIRNTSPSEALDVTGDIRASVDLIAGDDVHVADNAWVDGDLIVAGDIDNASLLSHTGQYIADRNCNGGDDFKTYTYMGRDDRRMCFLTRVNFNDTDATTEDAGCYAYVTSDNDYGSPYTSGKGWYLRAWCQDDADAACRAVCLTW